jgi:branched-chain amino acid transport system ATP-binding protein
MLSTRGLTVRLDGAIALRDVDIDIPDGAMTAVLGRNGAGKTTLLRTLAGLIRPTSGQVCYDGEPAPGRAWRVTALGVRFIPESGNVFADLTGHENLASAVPWLAPHARAQRIRAVVDQLPVLAQLLDRPAGQLSGGQRQFLAIARALTARPRVLLLDEPTLGLAPTLAASLVRTLREVTASQRATIVIAEQNETVVAGVTDHVIRLDTGQVTGGGATGGPAAAPRPPVAEQAAAVSAMAKRES